MKHAPRLKELAARLLETQRLVLTTHSGPDGDGIGSTLALARALQERGRNVTCLLPEPLPDRYRFLDLEGLIRDPGEIMDGPEGTWDLALVLDTNQWEMIGPVGDWLRPRVAKVVYLDHHPLNGAVRPEVFGDPDAASTGELVYRLLHHNLGWSLSHRVAESLYVSISFDTNSFKHIRSNPASLLIAADLITRGVDTNWVYRHLFASNSPSKARLLGWVLSSMRFECDGRLAYVMIPFRLIGELGLTRDETRDCIQHILEIRGVEVAATLKEMEPGEVKVSLRSKGACAINAAACDLGGGGHPLAAGCDLRGTCEEAWERVRPELVRAIEGRPRAAEPERA